MQQTSKWTQIWTQALCSALDEKFWDHFESTKRQQRTTPNPPPTCSLAVTVFSQIQVVLSCILLAATIFWTCIKIAKALREFDGEE